MKNNRNSFAGVAAREYSDNWDRLIERNSGLEQRRDDIRSEFGRDYTRILHSQGYRRLKNKTQVFFLPGNDHICTRIEHVNHVESVSFTVANYLGLNTELTKAVSIGHDLGHPPFGHQGEKVINELMDKELGKSFWHERNGLRFVDFIELLQNSEGEWNNLGLTYAVRDGIISHCGEINENAIRPREEAIDLYVFATPGLYQPYTWEGCVVKMADKISYMGRDIEDAQVFGIIRREDLAPLLEKARQTFGQDIQYINTTSLIQLFVSDLCAHSSPDRGLGFSKEVFLLMEALMTFSREKIYRNPRLSNYNAYSSLMINTIYKFFSGLYEGGDTLKKLKAQMPMYTEVMEPFINWLEKYWDAGERPKELQNQVIYRISVEERDYKQAIFDYISGMTDQFCIRTFENIVSFH